MDIKEINNKHEWESFLFQCEEKTFLQSWNWGEFQKMMDNKIWRFGIFEDNKLIAIALVVKNIARRGTFLLVPHGPAIKDFGKRIKKEVLETLVTKLKELAKEEKASFIRIAPIWERTKENENIFNSLKFIASPMLIHLEATWELDIRPEEEELLRGMRKTTRYLIKQAQKNKDIQIFQTKELENVEKFSELHNNVSLRQKFVPFSLKFLKNEFLSFKDDNEILIFTAKYKNEVVGSSMIIFNSGKAYYHQSALLAEYSKIPVIYLLMWEAIKTAKSRGCTAFDFWGYIDPQKQPNHPWAGPTAFKMGFGGQNKDFVKSKDLPLNNKYWLTFIFEKFRKLKRNL